MTYQYLKCSILFTYLLWHMMKVNLELLQNLYAQDQDFDLYESPVITIT